MKKHNVDVDCLSLTRKVFKPKVTLNRKIKGSEVKELETSGNSSYDLEKDPVFVNPLSDAGFKILFGNSGVEETESNKNDLEILKEGDLLKDMLNAFFDERIEQINKIKFKSVEVLGKTVHHRKVIYDLYFNDGNQREFIVEMQNSEISFMLNRIHNYTSVAHAQAMRKGRKFKHNQNSIIGVVIANFYLHEDEKMPCISVIENGDLKAGIVAMDLTKILTVELPKFNKNLDELVDKKDVYLYLLKNLGAMKEVPVQLDTKDYRPIFENARIANLKNEDYMIFDEERTQERKRQLELETAVEKAVKNTERKKDVELETAVEKAVKNTERKKDVELETAVEKAVKKATETATENTERKMANGFIASLIKEKVMTLERIATFVGVPINEVRAINNSVAMA